MNDRANATNDTACAGRNGGVAELHANVAESMDVMPERVIRYRMSDLTVVHCNAAWAAGHDLHPDQIVGRSLRPLLSEQERSGLDARLEVLCAEHSLVVDTVLRFAPDVPGRWVEWTDQYLAKDDGAEILTVGRDVTERHNAQLELAASEQRFRDLTERSADVVWRFVMEPTPHFDYMSPSVEKSLGYPPSLFLDDFTRFLDIVDDEGRDLIMRTLNGEQMPERCDLRYRCANGDTVIGEMRTSLIRDGLQGVSRDVTELRRLQADLAELALRDPLTGLANRRLLLELLDAALARSIRDDTPLAVAFLDLDGFKAINDTYGHDAGDTVLCETAKRLLSVSRDADVVARLGGDEFVVVYQPSAGDDPADDPGGDADGDSDSRDDSHDNAHDDLVRRITAALAGPIEVADDATICCPASVGRSDTSTCGHDAAALLAAADTAMYEAKRLRRCGRSAPDQRGSVAMSTSRGAR